VACFGSVGADEADGSVRVEDGALVAVSLDGAVEEDNGGAVCHGDDLVGNVGGTGGDHVDDQQVVAVGQSGLDLLVLGGLVVVAVEVLIGNAQGVELRVECGTDAGDVGISERVVEHANLQVGSLGRLSSRGLFSGGVFFGRGGLRSRRGLRSRGFGGLLGACRQSKYHGQRKKQSNDLFHLGKILHS